MKYVKQFSIILGISFLAELLEILIPLPIAASVYGLVIMLVGLITKLIPLEKVETAADFLVDARILFLPYDISVKPVQMTDRTYPLFLHIDIGYLNNSIQLLQPRH